MPGRLFGRNSNYHFTATVKDDQTMRNAIVLLLFLIPLPFCKAEQITSTTSVTTDDFFVDVIGATSISFEGTNPYDFSGDGVPDQELNYKLTVETSDSRPLVPMYDDGVQTGDLDLDSNLSPLVVTYLVEGMTELPGADPAYHYSFVSADFLGVEVTIHRGSELIFFDASAETNYRELFTTWFEMDDYGHEAAKDVELNKDYVFKASPEVGTQVLHSMAHSRFTVDVTAVPEPGIAGAFFALAIMLTKRRRS